MTTTAGRKTVRRSRRGDGDGPIGIGGIGIIIGGGIGGFGGHHHGGYGH